MNSKIKILVFFICLASLSNSIKTVQSFEELAELHCSSFPVELLYRLSTGTLSQVYGQKYSDLDCYIRQFVNKDGQDPFQQQSDEQDEEQSQGQEQILPEIDPIVIEYSKGLTQCLPSGVDKTEAVYAIWRFIRFVVQHDYALEWMRAKIRATLGYEAEKHNAWMDGEPNVQRLRLDKLFSNQFYSYVDTLMFKDFLHPIVTFLKKNLVFAASGQITKSGKPILFQYIQSKNLHQEIFIPILFKHKTIGNIFTYTIPGVPLLLGGSTSQFSWAFTGTLVDRSNIEQIQTLGNKFFHKDLQIWIKLQNKTETINIKGGQSEQCTYIHSNYGTLYEKHHAQNGKVSQYIARWHEDEKKVRVLFSQFFELLSNNGNTKTDLQFPFSSLVLTNNSGIYQYVCFQKHPSYFLYPDLAGAPEKAEQKWVANPKRNFIVISNTHLSTQNELSYIKKQIQNPTEEQFLIDVRRKLINSQNKFTLQSLLDFAINLNTDPLVKKRKEIMINIFRKVKFLFFPEETIRKQCDQLIAHLQKWDSNLNNQNSPGTTIFILWDYFLRQYTFNYVSVFKEGLSLAKHKIITDVYWTNQMDHWKAGISYGQCDSPDYDDIYRAKLNGTGDNSSCYLNVMKGINSTRQILRNEKGIREARLSQFSTVKLLDLEKGYIGDHIQQAFQQFHSKNIAFVAQIANSKLIYYQGYQETPKQLNLDDPISDPWKSVQKASQDRAQEISNTEL